MPQLTVLMFHDANSGKASRLRQELADAERKLDVRMTHGEVSTWLSVRESVERFSWNEQAARFTRDKKQSGKYLWRVVDKYIEAKAMIRAYQRIIKVDLFSVPPIVP